MKDSIHWNEEELGRILRDAQIAPGDNDWRSMEVLLDAVDKGSPALADPSSAIPGPALPARWSFWLFSGMLVGLLALMVHAALPALPEAKAIDLENRPTADIASVHTDTRLPDEPGSASRSIRMEEAPNPLSVHSSVSGSNYFSGPPPTRAGAGNSAHPPASAETAPAGSPESIPPATKELAILRPADKGFHELREEDYNTGLMAISRLKKPIRRPVSNEAFTLPPTKEVLPSSVQHWRFGIAAGGQMASAPYDPAAPFVPWIGTQVRHDLPGGWFLQSGISAKWLQRRGYYSADIRDVHHNNIPTELLQLRKADGLLVLEIPLLVGWQRGRWYGLGGARIAAGMATGPKQSLTVEEFGTSAAVDGLAGSPRNPDLGLTLGGGYFLHRSLCLELRYNHGFGVFLPANAAGTTSDFKHRDIQLGLAWWLGK